MEAIARISTNQDWITLLLLGVLFFIVLASLIDRERLKQLFVLPFTNYYLLNYDTRIWNIFNTSLFIASNLILALFIYLVQNHFGTSISFYNILSTILLYWFLKYTSGKLIATLFNLKKLQSLWVFIKASYFFSSTLYLLIFLFFAVYFFKMNRNFLIVMGVVYGILLIIRYYHFIDQYKRDIIPHFFYFILYLCALEIAPLLIVLKISF